MDRVESSKQASKRRTKQQRALYAAVTRDENQGLRISDEPVNPMSTPITNEEDMQSTNVDPPKKKRGPTVFKMVPDNNFQRMELEFNELGQVVGKNSDKFASIVGAMVREHVPVVIKDWHSVDEKKKIELWSFIQQRFNVSDCHQKMTFQSMGNYWRTFKSRLRKEIKNELTKSVNRTRTIALLRPKNVNSDEAWEKFVDETFSADFKEKSSKFSRIRTTQKLVHTMGRKGYPRTAHDMKQKNPNITGLRTKVWTHGHLRKDGKPINEAVSETLKKIEDCAQSISDTPAEDSIRDDAIARILGPERRGRVRGLGFGATPSKLDAQIQSTGRVRELESQLQTQSERMGTLEEKVEVLLKLSQQNQNKNAEDISSHAFTPQ